jgi:hypothetical protein
VILPPKTEFVIILKFLFNQKKTILCKSDVVVSPKKMLEVIEAIAVEKTYFKKGIFWTESETESELRFVFENFRNRMCRSLWPVFLIVAGTSHMHLF